ncbi:MAG: serine/threonine protein kinase bacterial [Candidatus Saganbacteria bacterium]|uniref:Serine/threonine protein kinase bacterial n=1 Tax=Candidatus Saganbacteria bacterium TaxID=2575572 RepID=A0A833L1N4_UNCSA|nr:MAG: serine/threonine protein kinase bacterial [Candidatus Saganbacteria bacterium]
MNTTLPLGNLKTPQLACQAPPHIYPGQKIGSSYIIKGKIAEGGMGVVYKAFDEQGNPAAVKIAVFGTEWFKREQEILRRLEGNPHVPQLLEVPVTNNNYYVMQFIDGITLHDEIEINGKISLPKAMDLMAQICFGLKLAAEKNICHRDIKPENIMLTNEGKSFIIDFGIGKIGNSNGGNYGTALFSSPQQMKGEPTGHRDDIYSLGVVFYCMLSGHSQPFICANNDDALYIEKTTTDLPPIKIKFPTLKDRVNSMLKKMLAVSREERCQTYEEILEAIEEIKGEIKKLEEQEQAIRKASIIATLREKKRDT